ncbi:MAG: tRNA pseudouridine(55) synthase TruB [Fibromonadales bacterium]|nr:tRNA pseudouridine(55) synthase TruB [Fibromonadales bacterium]
MHSGLILIDKPPGITSFRALHAIKKRFNTKRVGHAGTLDLAASGLIVAAIGKCTRLLPYIETQDKTYSFDLRLGILTDTLEPEGNILKQDDNAARTSDEINTALQTFIGEIEQIPPAFSAIKINGKRASDLALKGQEVKLKSRQIFIHELRLVGTSSIYCKCSKGTYIRSLARDIAEKLGTCGVAGNIRRVSIGGISVEQACDRLIPPQELLNWQVVNACDENAQKVLNGVPIPIMGENLVFISNNGKIIAVAEAQNGYLIPKFQL